MRLSRLLIAVAAAFSASAFAVAPPGFGPQQGPQPSPNTEERDQQGTGASSGEGEGNAWLSSTPSDAWQASAQIESQSTKEPERSAMYGEPPLPSDADKSSAPQLVPERMPAIGEQS